MIVIDTNIIAYLMLPGKYTEKIRRLFQRDPDWVAPALWRSEFRNVLAMEMRQNQLPLTDVLNIILEAEALLREGTYEVVSGDVLRLTLESSCSAYDCEFVSLALNLNVALVTMDKKILSAFPHIASSPNAFLALM